ncbi:MAG: phosphoglucomutase/phosphomannomutase family protein [Bacteroidetes bacterium]|nr:phosphoglucomutase/phosphomannomutase family protein [Bacteroidota bacterium]
MPIKFGTDGWRDVIAEGYTFENVARVSLATARYFKSQPNSKAGIFIGYDARFLSREFAELAARVIASTGLKVYLSSDICATPATSLAIVEKKLAGGVMITASHNPAKYNGYKIKGSYGGAALPSAIAKIEDECAKVIKSVNIVDVLDTLPALAELEHKGKISELDARTMYIKKLAKLVNIDRIERSGLGLAYDPMYGAGIETLERLMPEVSILHNVRNPGFGGTPPEPLPQNTKEFAQFVVEGGFTLGLVTDGDADRIGAIDENGTFFSSQMILCLLLKYLVEVKRKRGKVVVSLSVTSMIDRMCERYRLDVVRTPVGFKYITEYMLKGGVLIGGEESGGIGIPSVHIPERDGLFNGLLLAEICAYYEQSLAELVEDLEKDYGVHSYDRFDFHTTDARKKKVLKKASTGFKTIAGKQVTNTITTDGYKFELADGSWLMIRSSGTEPLLRYYAESSSPAMVKKLLAFAKAL